MAMFNSYVSHFQSVLLDEYLMKGASIPGPALQSCLGLDLLGSLGHSVQITLPWHDANQPSQQWLRGFPQERCGSLAIVYAFFSICSSKVDWWWLMMIGITFEFSYSLEDGKKLAQSPSSTDWCRRGYDFCPRKRRGKVFQTWSMVIQQLFQLFQLFPMPWGPRARCPQGERNHRSLSSRGFSIQQLAANHLDVVFVMEIAWNWNWEGVSLQSRFEGSLNPLSRWCWFVGDVRAHESLFLCC